MFLKADLSLNVKSPVKGQIAKERETSKEMNNSLSPLRAKKWKTKTKMKHFISMYLMADFYLKLLLNEKQNYSITIRFFEPNWKTASYLWAKDWLGGLNAPSEAGSYQHSEDIHRLPSSYLQVLYKPCPTFDGSTWRVNALIINIRQGFSLENVYDFVRQNQMSINLHKFGI